ncbi:hypothetical protein Bca4012_091140 [Brassica carinata]
MEQSRQFGSTFRPHCSSRSLVGRRLRVASHAMKLCFGIPPLLQKIRSKWRQTIVRHNLITFTAENVIQMQRRLPGNAYQKFKTNAILVAVVEITKVDTSTEHHALSLVSKHRTNTVDHASVVLSLSIACHSPQQTYAHNENVRWPSGSTECFSHTTTRGRQFDTREKRGGTGLAKKSLREFLARWPFGVSPVTIKSSTYTETYAHKSKYNDPK